MDYAAAGVDIERGDAFARYIAQQKSKAVSTAIGGFAGGTELPIGKYSQPVMLSCTDGVGTKLLVAQFLEKYDTVGIDLVAMCVNDLAAAGADPVQFLDYIACGAINEKVLQPVMAGIIKGCEQADCLLVGGETAELPDMYGPDDIDLAGFAVGIAEKKEILPAEGIKAGDKVFGLRSSGIHSNGLSLARKAVPQSERSTWEAMLVPTRIYVKELQILRQAKCLAAAAHITGGGLVANTERILPKNLRLQTNFDWEIPAVFQAIQNLGKVDTEEMRKVFNMGIGMTVICRQEDEQHLLETAKNNGIELLPVGHLVKADNADLED